jgi:integrase/recombinase XerD
MTIMVPEPSGTVAAQSPDPVAGPPPARNAPALAELMRHAGVSEDAMTATGGWLSGERRQSGYTQDGYIEDLSRWVAWCTLRGIDPVNAPATAADRFAASMRNAGLANATRARRLSAASSWLRYLLRIKAATLNPFDDMERPKVSQASETRGMSEDELDRFLACAQQCESARTFALLAVMATTACRVSSVIGAQVSGLGYDRGYQVIDLPVKGGHSKRFVLPAFAIDALAAWQAERGDESGYLFLTAAGKPLDQPSIFRTVRRVARKAGIPHWAELSSHGIRHTVLTILHDRSYPTHVIQDLAGHADSRTTRRYDLAREALDRSPANDLGAIFAAGIARHAAKFGDAHA